MTRAEKCLSRTLDWISGNLGRFTSVTELLDLAIVCRSIRGRDSSGRTEVFLDRVAQMPVSSAAALRHQLWLFAILCDTGRLRHPRVRDAMQRLIDVRHDDLTSGTTPLELVELGYVLGIGGFEHRLPAMEVLATGAAPSVLRHPQYADDRHGYAVTHLVLYLTDMAAGPVPGRLAERLRDLAADLLPLYAGARHWDVTAELLLCRRPLGLPWDETAQAAHDALLGAQLPDGSTPGIEYRPRSTNPFAQCYHATLATCLYMADAVAPARIASY